MTSASAKQFFACILGLGALIFAEARGETRLRAAARSDGRLELRWSSSLSGWTLETTANLAPPASWSEVSATPTLEQNEWVVTLPASGIDRYFRLRGGSQTTTIVETSPFSAETGVAVTRESVLRFSQPLAPGIVGTDSLFAEAAGRKLLGRAERASDGLTLTWFPLEPMPSGTRVRLSVKGNVLLDLAGQAVDADGDGNPGGTGYLEFETLGISAIPGTEVIGRVFASELGDGGTNRPLIGVTITVDGAEETLRTTTDTEGFFRLAPAPPGRFFVHVDGRTARGSQWPNGDYYPAVGNGVRRADFISDFPCEW